MRQISNRICVNRERFGETIFFVDGKKKQPHGFTRVCRFASNEIWRVNLRMQLFVASKYRLRSYGSKSDMAGRINDRELITLARTNKSSAQAKEEINVNIHTKLGWD